MSEVRNRTGSSLNLDTTVVGLQGFPISATPPSGGQALVFDGTNWVPTVVQTGGGTTVGPTPPSDPGAGDQWFNTGDNTLNIWNGSEWVPVDAANGGVASIGLLPPANPTNGQLWWDTVSGQLFTWYDDGSSAQWVIANVGIPGPQGPAGPAGAPGPNVMPPGVTDGSDAAPGEVGEYLYVQGGGPSITPGGGQTLVATLTLTPGDWDVFSGIVIILTGGSAPGIVANLSDQNPPPFMFPAVGTMQCGIITQGAALNTFSVALGPVRKSVSVNTPMYLFAAVNGGGTATGTSISYNMMARRMR